MHPFPHDDFNRDFVFRDELDMPPPPMRRPPPPHHRFPPGMPPDPRAGFDPAFDGPHPFEAGPPARHFDRREAGWRPSSPGWPRGHGEGPGGGLGPVPLWELERREALSGRGVEAGRFGPRSSLEEMRSAPRPLSEDFSEEQARVSLAEKLALREARAADAAMFGPDQRWLGSGPGGLQARERLHLRQQQDMGVSMMGALGRGPLGDPSQVNMPRKKPRMQDGGSSIHALPRQRSQQPPMTLGGPSSAAPRSSKHSLGTQAGRQVSASGGMGSGSGKAATNASSDETWYVLVPAEDRNKELSRVKGLEKTIQRQNQMAQELGIPIAHVPKKEFMKMRAERSPDMTREEASEAVKKAAAAASAALARINTATNPSSAGQNKPSDRRSDRPQPPADRQISRQPGRKFSQDNNKRPGGYSDRGSRKGSRIGSGPVVGILGAAPPVPPPGAFEGGGGGLWDFPEQPFRGEREAFRGEREVFREPRGMKRDAADFLGEEEPYRSEGFLGLGALGGNGSRGRFSSPDVLLDEPMRDPARRGGVTPPTARSDFEFHSQFGKELETRYRGNNGDVGSNYPPQKLAASREYGQSNSLRLPSPGGELGGVPTGKDVRTGGVRSSYAGYDNQSPPISSTIMARNREPQDARIGGGRASYASYDNQSPPISSAIARNREPPAPAPYRGYDARAREPVGPPEVAYPPPPSYERDGGARSIGRYATPVSDYSGPTTVHGSNVGRAPWPSDAASYGAPLDGGVGVSGYRGVSAQRGGAPSAMDRRGNGRDTLSGYGKLTYGSMGTR